MLLSASPKETDFAQHHKVRTDTKPSMHFLYEAQPLRYGIN